jgi:hypothetical protein
MGWGDTTQNDFIFETSNILLETTVNVISNEVCSKSTGKHNGDKETYDGQITENVSLGTTNTCCS